MEFVVKGAKIGVENYNFGQRRHDTNAHMQLGHKVTFGSPEKNRFQERVPIDSLRRFKQAIMDQGWTEFECREIQTYQLR